MTALYEDVVGAMHEDFNLRYGKGGRTDYFYGGPTPYEYAEFLYPGGVPPGNQ